MTLALPPTIRPSSGRADVRRWHDGPTPVSLADLSTMTRTIADEVAGGHHEVRVDTTDRWSRRLHADAHLKVWLVGWAPAQAAELHDHGGSLGALAVARGELTEWHWSAARPDDHVAAPEELGVRGPGLRRRVLGAGRGAVFGLGHVHDVANRGVEPAVAARVGPPRRLIVPGRSAVLRPAASGAAASGR